MIEILKKEIRQFFTSPSGYIICAVYTGLSSLYFYAANLNGLLVSLSYDFQFQATWLLLFLMPLLTMRLLAEERQMKTDQLLLTSPVTVGGIVFGKFLASMGIFLFCTSVNLLFFFIAAHHSQQPILGEFICCYTGFLLLGAGLTAVDMLLSALTESPFVAAFSAIGVNVLLMVTRSLADSIRWETGRFLLRLLSVFTRFFNDFARGIFSIPSLFYYLSFSALFLFLTALAVEKRRWS